MTNKDWLLVAVAAADHEGLDPVQLQKSLFLFGEKGREFAGKGFYRFEPHNYGPFCLEVYRHADALVAQGLISRTRRPGCSWSAFTVTDAGLKEANTLRRGPGRAGAQYLNDLVAFVRRKSFYELVQLIYQLYPKYKAKSIFRP